VIATSPRCDPEVPLRQHIRTEHAAFPGPPFACRDVSALIQFQEAGAGTEPITRARASCEVRVAQTPGTIEHAIRIVDTETRPIRSARGHCAVSVPTGLPCGGERSPPALVGYVVVASPDRPHRHTRSGRLDQHRGHPSGHGRRSQRRRAGHTRARCPRQPAAVHGRARRQGRLPGQLRGGRSGHKHVRDLLRQARRRPDAEDVDAQDGRPASEDGQEHLRRLGPQLGPHTAGHQRQPQGLRRGRLADDRRRRQPVREERARPRELHLHLQGQALLSGHGHLHVRHRRR